MLKITKAELDALEPGLRDSVLRYENAKLPACTHCGAEDAASVQVGIVGRSMNIAVCTTKMVLIPNLPKEGNYYCHACKKYYA